MNRLFLVLLGGILLSGSLEAQLVQARFVTSAYAWQRSDTVGKTANHLYAFESGQVSVGGKNISVNAYGQWSNDFGGPLNSGPTFRLYNFSVRGKDLYEMLDLQGGRFYVVEGAGNGLMDGGQATVRLPFAPVKVTGYYGILSPPGQELKLNDAPSDNAMGGAHVVVQPMEEVQASVSYAYKSIGQSTYRAFRADSSLFGVYAVDLRPSARTEQLISADANVDLPGRGDGYFRCDFDAQTEALSRINLFGRAHVIDRLSVTAEYLQREPRVAFNSIFSVFAYSTLKEVEGGVEYGLTEDWQLVARYGNVSYGDESSNRITLAANSRLVSASLSHDATYSGEISAASVVGSYPLMENRLTPHLVLSYARYKLEENSPLQGAFSLAAGASARPTPVLLVDGQIQWLTNKIYANDVRIFLRASYLLSHRLGWF